MRGDHAVIAKPERRRSQVAAAVEVKCGKQASFQSGFMPVVLDDSTNPKLKIETRKPMPCPAFKRVLLKLSGEALPPIRASEWTRRAYESPLNYTKSTSSACRSPSWLAAAIFSAASPTQATDMDRVSADHMGMLATVINALALQDALEKQMSSPG